MNGMKEARLRRQTTHRTAQSARPTYWLQSKQMPCQPSSFLVQLLIGCLLVMDSDNGTHCTSWNCVLKKSLFFLKKNPNKKEVRYLGLAGGCGAGSKQPGGAVCSSCEAQTCSQYRQFAIPLRGTYTKGFLVRLLSFPLPGPGIR